MLQRSTLNFLKALEKNNNKPWFDENRKTYEAAKADVQNIVGQLIPTIASFDEPIGALQIKDCIFRINRDVRFSKNKQPYKNNMSAYFSPGGKKSTAAGYYFHIEPGKSFVAGGIYTPMPAELAKIRQEIDYNFDALKSIIGQKPFKKYFPTGMDAMESLVRPPKGYDENNPAIDYLKRKHFIVSTPISDVQLEDKNLVKELAKIFAAIQPMNDFLNHAIA
jgi:uncharacterized protein (TIGR02453 family)